MYSLWLLPAMLLAAWMYFVWKIRQSRRRELHKRLESVIQLSVPDELVPESGCVQARQMKWIKWNEFKTVLGKCGDLIVIDLRPEAPRVPFPVSAPTVLPVSPNELDAVLESLPADKSAVFCGASNLCIFLIETSPCMAGSAPLYVLEGDLSLAEVA